MSVPWSFLKSPRPCSSHKSLLSHLFIFFNCHLLHRPSTEGNNLSYPTGVTADIGTDMPCIARLKEKQQVSNWFCIVSSTKLSETFCCNVKDKNNTRLFFRLSAIFFFTVTYLMHPTVHWLLTSLFIWNIIVFKKVLHRHNNLISVHRITSDDKSLVTLYQLVATELLQSSTDPTQWVYMKGFEFLMVREHQSAKSWSSAKLVTKDRLWIMIRMLESN